MRPQKGADRQPQDEIPPTATLQATSQEMRQQKGADRPPQDEIPPTATLQATSHEMRLHIKTVPTGNHNALKAPPTH
jgi:hypothetical protein